MAHIILFHSILGLRPVERELAATFEAAGHKVTLPDLFGGLAADDYDQGFALKRQVGDAAILDRARAALETVPDDTVLAGVSFGADLVGTFWGDRPKMADALLFAGIAPWMAPRRHGLPVSVHIARPDPFDEEAFFAEWSGEADGVALEMHRYDGPGHYFLDPSLTDYDAEAAALCVQRSLAFLGAL